MWCPRTEEANPLHLKICLPSKSEDSNPQYNNDPLSLGAKWISPQSLINYFSTMCDISNGEKNYDL